MFFFFSPTVREDCNKASLPYAFFHSQQQMLLVTHAGSDLLTGQHIVADSISSRGSRIPLGADIRKWLCAHLVCVRTPVDFKWARALCCGVPLSMAVPLRFKIASLSILTLETQRLYHFCFRETAVPFQR